VIEMAGNANKQRCCGVERDHWLGKTTVIEMAGNTNKQGCCGVERDRGLGKLQ